ncbi:Ribosomal silencing factor RsfS [Pseudogemmobacter humi]|uniref:Ribosomal silencing factor RsfS n=1 Tax=Pseudogemmobacter humi TaxID=2483812 RepID=A0A3P5WNK8_9RHOB|nr:Ribosomal silencing factor RsfS [Pseudogemmobacter humi]
MNPFMARYLAANPPRGKRSAWLRGVWPLALCTRVTISPATFVEIAGPGRYPERERPCAGAESVRHQEDQVLSHTDPTTGLPVAPRAGRPAQSDHRPEEIRDAVLASLEDDKAESIVEIDLRGRSDVADFMVICSGRSSRQVAAIAEKLADRLKQVFGIGVKMEGKETGDWVLIDSGDVIVHVFRPEVRDFYQLEKMWLPAGQVGAARTL